MAMCDSVPSSTSVWNPKDRRRWRDHRADHCWNPNQQSRWRNHLESGLGWGILVDIAQVCFRLISTCYFDYLLEYFCMPRWYYQSPSPHIQFRQSFIESSDAEQSIPKDIHGSTVQDVSFNSRSVITSSHRLLYGPWHTFYFRRDTETFPQESLYSRDVDYGIYTPLSFPPPEDWNNFGVTVPSGQQIRPQYDGHMPRTPLPDPVMTSNYQPSTFPYTPPFHLYNGFQPADPLPTPTAIGVQSSVVPSAPMDLFRGAEPIRTPKKKRKSGHTTSSISRWVYAYLFVPWPLNIRLRRPGQITSSEARVRAKDSSAMSVRDFQRVNTEVESKCCWNGCNSIINNSLSGIQGHIYGVHHTNEMLPKENIRCYWGSCNGALYAGGSSLGQHIRGTHLRLDDVICPICQITIANGASPARRHMQKNHPEVKI